VLFWVALFVLSMGLQYVAAIAPRTALGADAPVVTLESGTSGCNGVRPTPGSENTHKRLTGGTLLPGHTVEFTIDYPVDPSDVAGRTTFVITDCVFINGNAALKYSVSFVPNTVDFVLVFDLTIPAGTPIGAEYCNYAKTTAAPSSSQASNRKAGPACFIVGGNISILKVDDATGDPLGGATFSVDCTWPTTTGSLPDTIISWNGNSETIASTSGGSFSRSLTTGADGRIAIQAPEGTKCVVEETQAPDTYTISTDGKVTLTASAGGVSHTFRDTQEHRTLSITKTDNTTSYDHVGQVIGFTITATNTGNVPQDITVNDSPALDGFSCTPTNGTTVAPGASMVCTGTHTVTQADLNAGKFDDTACANASGADEACANDTVPGDQNPSLSITKVATEGSYSAVGDVIHYTIVATNTGNTTIASATVTDANALNLVCTPANGSELAPGASPNCTADHTVTQADIDAGHYLNTACVDDGEGGATKVCADADVNAEANPNLSITKVATEDRYSAVGDVIHYTITATNTGNTTLDSVTVTDANAANLTCTPANGSSLAPGAKLDCTADHTVTQADIDAGHYLNTACVSATNVNNTCANADVNADQNPHLIIVKDVTETTYDAVGDVLHYTITATNDGNTTLDSVNVTDTTATGLSCTPTNGSSLAPGAAMNCTATHTITQADIDAGHYLNTACVDASGATQACDTADVVGATLTISKTNNAPIETLDLPNGKTADLPTADEGATVTFTLTYTLGEVNVTNGKITDVLPAGLTYVNGSATSNDEFTFDSYNPANRTLTWNAESVTAGGSLTYQAKVDVGANLLAQPLENTATIKSDQTAADHDTSDVFVPAPPLSETSKPTPPPTDALGPTEPSNPGTSLMLLLAVLGVLIVGIGFITPVPAAVRRRNRR
jgi:uncharacterized repeat protein (TIGR01451 family)